MNERLVQFDEKMQKTMNNLGEEFGSIRAGRANPHVLDKLRVDYYGTPTPIQQVANVSVLFPELTEERRKDLAKDVKKKGENAKVAIRNIRRDANDSFKKLAKEDVSEDEIKTLEESAQKMTDKYIAEVDKAVEVKTKEIMTV